MLIRFTAENFRSINEEIVLSLIPGRMQKHGDHVALTDQEIKVLRLALLYGPNASGKSNVVRAMDFARRLIVEGLPAKREIPVEPFLLDKGRPSQPSRFEFEFNAGIHTYAYGFVLDRQRVYEEWLYLVKLHDETPLFERKTDDNDVTHANFGNIATKDVDPQFLRYVARGTRPNQLLLTELIENNVGTFDPPYNWFRNRLQIVFPHSHARGIQLQVHKNQKYSQALAAFLREMHTGIEEVNTRRVEMESIDLPMEMLANNLDAGNNSYETANGASDSEERMVILDSSLGHRYLLARNDTGQIEAHALNTRRFIGDTPVDFELLNESDGTRRLFDLFPILYGAEDRVFVIDELERSLHPSLVRRFVDIFLESKTRNQLIVTTHESTLLDLELVRRDEIWFVEKSPSGASILYSLEDFKPRHDLDIRRGYLQGRFGAIPIFGSNLEPEHMEA